ncbi:hypothetical protein Barb7_00032 [Bacteroidales bacterium Barb7]|nr:hypothetical protein Barb7_00067 [Bacteroidales bacterium Barb7]OAV76302.1 hypothetical protein Barb7_00016 [Bacteroidales bacterium Barb7]OAV76318.1 hypothetical protein Barb7_00032 [Bacteroidales bacterium Barb7]
MLVVKYITRKDSIFVGEMKKKKPMGKKIFLIAAILSLPIDSFSQKNEEKVSFEIALGNLGYTENRNDNLTYSGLTVGYWIFPKYRIDLSGGYAFSDDTHSLYTASVLLTPFSPRFYEEKFFLEASVGAGFQKETDEKMLFIIPARIKAGGFLTKKIACGVGIEPAISKEKYKHIYSGAFLAFRF